MKAFFLFSALIFSLAGFCQVNDVKSVTINDSVYTAADVSPQYMGNWDKYLEKNLKYPNSDLKDVFSGDVLASFIVEKDGSISNILIKDGKGGDGIQSEIIRLLQASAPWMPARLKGKRVRFRTERSFEFKAPVEELDIFTVVEKMPEFPGGTAARDEYFARNMVIPESMVKDKVHGTVFVTFVVEEDGTISDERVLRGLNQEADQEALRLIKMMPKWIPGEQRNHPVRVQTNFPVKF